MNISPLTIYLWQLADDFRSNAFIISMIALVVGVILIAGSAIASMEPQDLTPEKRKKIRCWGVVSCLFAGVFFFANTFVPSSKTIAMMVIIPKIAESSVVKQDLPDLYDIAIKTLKEQLTPKK